MNTKKTLLLCLATFAGIAVHAQEANGRVLSSSNSVYLTYTPSFFVDEQTKLKTVKWPNTEDWNDNSSTIMVENVAVKNDLYKVFPQFKIDHGNIELTKLAWELKQEGKHTVMHCYFEMKADVVKNFWLASKETAIVDMKTGKNYRAIRSEPDCWGKYFAVKAKEGDILDFKIYFPKLPSSVTDISIYGIPNWRMRGLKVKIHGAESQEAKYDEVPEFHMPRLVKAEGGNYEKSDGNSWAVYTDAHLVKPVEGDGKTMAIWRTEDATYLAVAYEQNWMREYMAFEPGTVLVDNMGNKYKLKEVKGVPTGHIFWMEGYSGDYVAFLKVFEPLPLNVNTINYIEPDGEPFEAWAANWEGTIIKGLSVEELRANQKLFEYCKRNIVR